MGLKTTNYTIEQLGITLDNAYAQITNLSIDASGKAHCIFTVQKAREDIQTKTALENKFFMCEIDKTLPVHEQVYNLAKADGMFEQWVDDIVDSDE